MTCIATTAHGQYVVVVDREVVAGPFATAAEAVKVGLPIVGKTRAPHG